MGALIAVHVTVLGATGKIGRLAVERLLADGHRVTALVRNPDKPIVAHPDLNIHVGQLSDTDAVRQAVAGSDAVLSALGPPLRPGTDATPLTDGTRIVVAAMADSGVRRYVGLATPSIPDPRDRPTAKAKLIPIMAKLFFPKALADVIGMTAAVTGSDLDWTIVRITNPTDRPPTGTLRAGFLGDDIGWAMSRADIATFLVGQLTDTTYLRSAPAISN